MNQSLNRTGVIYLQNKSGGTLAYGDVGVVSLSNATAVTTTTTASYISGLVVVVVDKAGIINNDIGLFAYSGAVEQINLASSASVGDLISTHTVAGQGQRHSAPMVQGDFAQALTTGTSPSAILFGNPAPPNAGSVILLGSQTASGSATLDFTSMITSTYDSYKFVVVNIFPATNTTRLWMRFSTDNGATFLSTSVYTHSQLRQRAGTSASSGAEIGSEAGQIDLMGDDMTNTGTRALNGEITLNHPLGTTYYKDLIGHTKYYNGSHNIQALIQGQYASTGDVDAVRFLMSSGNIASGSIYMYGLKKS